MSDRLDYVYPGNEKIMKADKLRILILEDNPADTVLMTAQLHENGLSFEYKTVRTENEFRKELEKFMPDVILSDFAIPGFSGLEALRVTQATFPFIPLIIVSGVLKEEGAVALLKAGASDYLLKQNISRLGSAVNNAITLRRTMEEKARAEDELRKSYQELEQRVQERTVNLLASESRYRNALDRFYLVLSNMTFGVLLVTGDDIVEFANQAFCDMYNLKESPDEMKNLTSHEMIEKIQNEYMDRDQAVTRIQTIVKQKQIVHDEEVLMRDGRTFLRDYIPIPMGDNKVSRLWTQKEITKLKHVEEELRDSRERLNLALHSSRMGILDWDIVNNKRTWSSGVHGLLGTKPETFTGKEEEFFKLIYPEDRVAVRTSLARAVKTGEYDTEYRIVWPDGSIHHIATRGKVHRDKTGRAIHMTTVCWDITEHKKAEEVLKRDRETLEKMVSEKTNELLHSNAQLDRSRRMADVGRLSATIAHELRNPLAAIRAALYNVRRKAKNPALDKHFETINKKILESDQIIANLLGFTRIKTLNIEKLNMCELIKDCIVTVTAKYADWNVELRQNLDCKEGDFIEADVTQLKMLCGNILDNAYQSLHDKSGTITLTVQKPIRETWKISVTDTGIGMDEQEMKRIYEPFYTTKPKGTGLGLAVSREIVDIHCGKIEMQSTKGVGTTFTVTLPVTNQHYECPFL
ncbi:MAG: ATP-binding protein [Endomicrobiales bacterium]|jgi:PAS domain S-box-containing protein